ncbi:MAG TPA: helix-turn-helix transcriptional regulator [Opitutaceae bacterium]|nr:helix-turn-helix transcriptional regulator [Opitutaceae bacterium]
MPKREPVLRKLGQKVREKREIRNLSQEDLAEHADLDRTYIGGIERGERNPTIISVLRIAKALKASVSELCEGIDR